MSDDRLKKPASQPQTEGMRSNRALEDRAVTENREISDAERLKVLSSGYLQIKLPNLPAIAGYHTCWLSTNNPGDTVAWRLQLGYQLLTPAEVPGWQHGTCASPDYAGYVGVHEMIGAKIRTDLYEKLMKHMHHDEPNSMEVGIKSQLEQIQGDAESAGGRIDLEDGMKDLGRTVAVPASW